MELRHVKRLQKLLRSLSKTVEQLIETYWGSHELEVRLAELQIRAPEVLRRRAGELAAEAAKELAAVHPKQAALLGLPPINEGISVGVGAVAPRPAVDTEAFESNNELYVDKTARKYVSEVVAIVVAATAAGQTLEDVSDEIAQRGLVAESRAKVIAINEVLSANAALMQEMMEAAGVEEYIWSTMLDDRVRPAHAKLEGVRCRWDTPPLHGNYHPGEDIDCRCVPVPVSDGQA